MKVLSFAPYQNWDVHHQLDRTLLRALRQRGADTVMVTCDGTLLAGACYGVTVNQANWLAECRKCGERGCKEGAAAAGRQLAMGSYLTPADYDAVELWIQEVMMASTFKVKYQEWDIGDWVLGTIHTHLKSVHEESERFRELFQRYCRSGLLCAMAMDRILDAEKPDHLILFGGRDSPYRITFELAQKKGIKILYHERGYVDDSFVLAEDETVFDKAFKLTPPLADWMAAPLTRAQCLFTRNYFLLREQGRGMNWPAYLGRRTAPSSVRSRLGIPDEARICALFTSTPYELEAFLQVPSSDQWRFMENMLTLFAGRDEWLVIRVHPNTSGRTVESTDLESIQYFAEMQRRAPGNVVVIMPDEEFNSYALLHVADVVLAPFSSVAYEGAARGVPSAVMGSWIGLGCIGKLKDVAVDSLRELLNRLSTHEIGDVEVLRQAYRFAYLLTSRVCTKFASFGMRDIHGAEQRYATEDDLLPGCDATLDRLCDHVLKGGPLYQPVAAVPVDEEEAFLADESARLRAERKTLAEVMRRAETMQLGPLVTLISLGAARPAGRPLPEAVEVILAGDWHAALPAALAGVQTPYVAFWLPGVEHLDRFHGSLLDALQQCETAPAFGARHGAWLADAGGVIRSETLSARTAGLRNDDPVWQSRHAWSLLCLGVFRRSAFAEWFTAHAGDNDEAFAAAAREWLLSTDLLAPARPMAVLHPNRSAP